MATISKLAEKVENGDVIQTEDGFTLCHLRVQGIEFRARTRTYTFYGLDLEEREYGEHHFEAGDTVEVVTDG